MLVLQNKMDNWYYSIRNRLYCNKKTFLVTLHDQRMQAYMNCPGWIPNTDHDYIQNLKENDMIILNNATQKTIDDGIRVVVVYCLEGIGGNIIRSEQILYRGFVDIDYGYSNFKQLLVQSQYSYLLETGNIELSGNQIYYYWRRGSKLYDSRIITYKDCKTGECECGCESENKDSLGGLSDCWCDAPCECGYNDWNCKQLGNLFQACADIMKLSRQSKSYNPKHGLFQSPNQANVQINSFEHLKEINIDWCNSIQNHDTYIKENKCYLQYRRDRINSLKKINRKLQMSQSGLLSQIQLQKNNLSLIRQRKPFKRIKQLHQLIASLKSELLEALFADGYHLDQLFIEDEPQSDDDIRFAKRIEIIVYDYDEIKKHRAELHADFKYVYRFFSRLLRIRYDTPIAVAVPHK